MDNAPSSVKKVPWHMLHAMQSRAAIRGPFMLVGYRDDALIKMKEPNTLSTAHLNGSISEHTMYSSVYI